MNNKNLQRLEATMELKVPEPLENKLKDLEKKDRERIMKKLESINQKLKMGIEPEKVLEKRLKGPLHNFLQQRIGRWRLWFEVYEDEEVVRLEHLMTKEEAEKHY